MFSPLNRHTPSNELLSSKLFNESTFYDTFTKDLNDSLHEVIIESPFIAHRRLAQLLPTLHKLKDRKVRVVVNTRDPQEHDDEYLRNEAHQSISSLQHLGVQVLFTVGHHRKLVIIDRHILYEGILNVLSQNHSSEVMRRVESTQLAWQMVRFVEIDKFLN